MLIVLILFAQVLNICKDFCHHPTTICEENRILFVMFTAMKNYILDSSSATLGNTLPTRGCRNKDNSRDIKELNIDIVSKMHIG